MDRKVIGLVGAHGAGKTTVTKYLVWKYGFHRAHLGASVKVAVQLGFGLTSEHVDGAMIDKPCELLGGVTPRAVLEAVGDATHRAAPEATAIAWENSVRRSQHAKILADGIRRVSEARAVKRLGGVVIRIDRPGHFDPNLPCDISQAAVEADLVIHNTGTESTLLDDADRICQYILRDSIP